MKPDSMLPFEDESAVKEPDIALPEGKTSFKPEELYRFTKIKPFVLRFWESEFPSLKPKKEGAEGLVYSRADVEMILTIKHLLYEEGLTLAGARQRLSGEEDEPVKKAPPKKKGAAKKPAPKKAPAAARTKAATPDKGGAKRGLPADGARSRVSLEELLPDNSAGAGEDPAKAPAPPKKKAATKAATPAGTASSDPEKMRRALSKTLDELRGILTFLHKGDR